MHLKALELPTHIDANFTGQYIDNVAIGVDGKWHFKSLVLEIAKLKLHKKNNLRTYYLTLQEVQKVDNYIKITPIYSILLFLRL